jgi:predicted nucleotidyltransferase
MGSPEDSAHHGQVTPQSELEEQVPVVPWLDVATAGLVRAIVATVADRHPELCAVILYGSVARHEERPLDDPQPSDVDLLLLFRVASGVTRLPYELHLAISHSIGLAEARCGYPPREVQTLPVVWNLPDWDATFVESVARDGFLLWARGPLPPALADIAFRSPGWVADEPLPTHQ